MGLFGFGKKTKQPVVTVTRKTPTGPSLKETEEKKLEERFNLLMPKVKKYLDSVGFDLPSGENVFFMEIDDSTGKWKYETQSTCKYWSTKKSDFYGDDCYGESSKYKYQIEDLDEKKVKRPCADGVLLTPEGKAYIGRPDANGNFWWHTESGKGVDNSFQPVIHNVVAVGNITNQLLCGTHIKINGTYKKAEYVDSPRDSKGNIKWSFKYTNNGGTQDVYWCDYFPKSVKRVFILPSDECTKSNTVILGSTFNECSNLRLFYCGFDKCEHEKLLCVDDTYKVFADGSRAEFVSPSNECLKFFNDEKNCKNWEFKVGTKIQEALTAAEKENAVKEEAEAKVKQEKETQLAETKEVLAQLESDLAAKKAEIASLGMDAQAIVKKAKLNKEIKELEPQIETLKKEVEKLSK